ncbi:MAG: hypothetical protein ACI9BF_000948 [Candidatus Paceibacteria bacterium]|jgi:hypothetical protein
MFRVFVWYTSSNRGMNPFNKNFYKFLFRFMAIVTTTLVLILLVNMFA